MYKCRILGRQVSQPEVNQVRANFLVESPSHPYLYHQLVDALKHTCYAQERRSQDSDEVKVTSLDGSGNVAPVVTVQCFIFVTGTGAVPNCQSRTTGHHSGGGSVWK